MPDTIYTYSTHREMLAAVKAITSGSLFVDNKSEDNLSTDSVQKRTLTIVYLRERERLEHEELNTVHRSRLFKRSQILNSIH